MIIDKALREKYGIKTVEALIEGLKVGKSTREFHEFKLSKLEDVRGKYKLEEVKDNPIIRSYRDFYWRIGIDPTKTRPSSEALLRRVLAGRDMPEINNCVDAYNLASILTLISMGAYDNNKIEGELRIRTSHGEKFVGIGGKTLETQGEIVMSDDNKILNIFPYRDSEITKITTSTRSARVVLAGVRGISKDYLLESAETAIQLITKFCGGRGEILG
jgi:DNA/RNA-binding domain of Phe-tRNA-synthetase-like protein